jgi:hypothetical protein
MQNYMFTTNNTTQIDWTRISNDINGNPRFVCHFLEIANDYQTAAKLANTIGGRKYNKKNYGGGIVFQSYNIADTAKKVLEISQTH